MSKMTTLTLKEVFANVKVYAEDGTVEATFTKESIALRCLRAGAKEIGVTIVEDPNMTKPDMVTVADEFIRQMQDGTPDTILATIDERNAAETEIGVCHTHDFCDANEVMESALGSLGVEVFPNIDEGIPDEVITLWNAAWAIAKAKGFSRKVEA